MVNYNQAVVVNYNQAVYTQMQTLSYVLRSLIEAAVFTDDFYEQRVSNGGDICFNEISASMKYCRTPQANRHTT